MSRSRREDPRFDPEWAHKMIIKVKVIAGAKENNIEKISENEYKIHLKERAEKGKANKKLIELLADYFNCKKTQIEIKQGFTSNIKVIEIY